MKKRKKLSAIILVLFSAIAIVYGFLVNRDKTFKHEGLLSKQIFRSSIATIIATPVPVASPTPTPTPRPLTFAEMNSLYGPCIHLPVLMYHHIQSIESAKALNQVGLTVNTDDFQNQMLYLNEKGYLVASMNDLINFFNSGTPIAGKSVLLTFDDGYADFYVNAYPILQSLGFKATMFTPTGLVNNPDYLTWDQISQMTGPVLFANHTWSHKNVVVPNSVMQYEILTADTQLTEHGLNSPKVFAYPYGFGTKQAENYLLSLGYQAAFTTVPGSTLCKKQRFELPRIRIGNGNLSSYGF